MHFMGADLDFHGLRAGTQDRGVYGAVQIILRGGNIIVEFPGNELPQRVHHPERRIAIGNGIDEHARSADIHQLFECQMLGLHFAPDAVDVLRPPLDACLDPGAAQFAAQMRLQLLHVALALGAPRLQSGGDAFIVGGLQVTEGQIFQFPFQLPHPQAVGEGRVHFAGFHRKLSLQRRVEGFCGAHFLQLSGEAHHHQTYVADHGQQHLAQSLGLARLEAKLRPPIRAQAEFPQLAQAARQPRGVRAELLVGGGGVQELGIEQRLHHGCDHHIVVGIECAHDLRDIEAGAHQSRGAVRQIERAQCGKGREQPLARRDPG
jgi:hypothetical protein